MQSPVKGNADVMVVSGEAHDRLLTLAALMPSRWRIHFAQDASDALQKLAAQTVPVVIIDGDAPKAFWRDLLEQSSMPGDRPESKFIVFSRHADARLWSEVFSRGGFDLLPNPFDPDQLGWVVRAALSEWNAARESNLPAGITEEVEWIEC